jgi:dethiobiotin synthetase
MTIVVVTGTGTEIGKTWVSARVLERLRAHGVAVAARKPAQSFAPDDLGPYDADVLGAASGEPAELVCPPHRWYPVAMAPPMAAARLARPRFTIADLVAELVPAPGACTLVETAGGVHSPLADDGATPELCEALAPDGVVVVADAGLGTINAVRGAVRALSRWRTVVHLNRFAPDDPLHVANRDWLRTRDGLEVVTDPEALARWIDVG